MPADIMQFRLAIMAVTKICPTIAADMDHPVAMMEQLAAYVDGLKLELAEAKTNVGRADDGNA